MKQLILLLVIIGAGLSVSGQNAIDLNQLNGKYQFIYNDTKCIVDFISSSNTFIEYDENFNHLTDGTFTMTNGVFYLNPIMTTNSSQINIPVNFTIIETKSTKMSILYNTTEVSNRPFTIYKL